jgi:predicted TIM-barrel fold metal-dependent hydrolase
MHQSTAIGQVLPRRSLLQIAAASSLAVAAGNRSQPLFAQQPRQASSPAPRIDCHLHCFAGSTDQRFPYHDRAPYRPAESATPQHLLHCMAGADVSHAIVVHPEPYQDDHRYLEYCLEIGKGKLKGTALVFADSPGAIGQLTDLVKRLPIVATRVHAYAPDRLPPLGSSELRALWRCAAELGIAVQLHFEPRYAPGFEPLIREFRDTPVIIDHLGRPFQGTLKEHAVVVKWAEHKNTWMKVSSIPATTQYPHRDISPIIRQLTEAYGPDRMLYGGGFNAAATPDSYNAAFDRAAMYLSDLSDRDRGKVLGGNAMKLFFS